MFFDLGPVFDLDERWPLVSHGDNFEGLSGMIGNERASKRGYGEARDVEQAVAHALPWKIEDDLKSEKRGERAYHKPTGR